MSGQIDVLSTHNLHYLYPDQTTGLFGITCTIPQGKKTVILGPNGAGKSTLLLMLNGIYTPKQGEVLIDRQPVVYTKAGLTKLRTRVGLVMQHPDIQLFSPVVCQDVAYGPTNLGLKPDQVKERVESALQLVGASSHMNKPVHWLSHGEKQRVAIAGVLAMESEIILLDEPTAGLDRTGVSDLLAGLATLQDRGATLVMSTHDIDLAWRWADHIIVMDKGKKSWEGDFEQIAGQLELFEQLGFELPAVGLVLTYLKLHGCLTRVKHTPRTMNELICYLDELQLLCPKASQDKVV